MTPEEIEKLAEDDAMIEIGRKAIEDVALDFRESRISQIRGNGIVCLEKDGTGSPIIRFGPDDALRIGLNAIAKKMREGL